MLVWMGGGPRDRVVFQTALAAARPLSAHLACLHVHVTLGETARDIAVHARGSVLRNALVGLQTKQEMLSRASKTAADNVQELCASAMVELRDARPPDASRVTPSFREEQETDNSLAHLISQARNSELVVMGRAKQRQ